MTWEDEYPAADGTCHDCGMDLDDDPGGDHDENHRQCWECWRKEQGIPEQPWRKPRPGAGAPPPSLVEGLAQVREQLRVLTERVEQLERRRAA
jgi:hypothetical protein